MKRKNRSDSRRETVTPTLLWVADVVVFAALLLLVFVLVRPRPASTPSGVLAQTASGGMDISIDSVRPPDCRPNRVPRS